MYMTHTHDDESISTEETLHHNHEVEHLENEPSIPVIPKPHRFTPPIHGNKFGGANNFGNHKQRPGRAAQRGR